MTSPTDDELAEMSKAWGVSVERLRFLATCPHYDSKPHIRVDDYKDPTERHIAKAIREAIRGSWLPSDAAKIAKVEPSVIEAFVCRHGIIWPPNCRRRLEWGRGTTHAHRLEEERRNLLAKGKPSMLEAAKMGVEQGLTAKEAAEKFGFSSPGMYNAATSQGLKFISHLKKYGVRHGRHVAMDMSTNPQANTGQSSDPILAEARASVELSLRNSRKA